MVKHLIISILLVSLTLGLQGQRMSEDDVRIEDLYIAANQKKILKKYGDAIQIYKKILGENEVNAAVHHDMARIYLAMEEKEKAVSSAKKAVKFGPENIWYQMTLAQIYEEEMNFQGAASALRAVLAKRPTEEVYIRWAKDLELGDQKAAAIEALNEADQKFGWSEYRSDAKVDLLLALDKQKEAIAEVKKWSDRYPNNSDYLVKLAAFHEFLSENKKAKKLYAKVLEIDPFNETAILKNQASLKGKDNTGNGALSLVNDDRISLDNKIKAIIPILDSKDASVDEACLSLIEQYPDDAKVHALYGDALWLQERNAEAAEQYKKSLIHGKGVYQVWDQLMAALSLEQNMEELADVSSDALDYYPNQAGPYYYQAYSALKANDLDEADELVDEALFIGGNGKDYIIEKAHLLKATILDTKGDTEAAAKYFEGISDNQRSAATFEMLGDLYFKLGQKTKAATAWKESITLGGDKSRITTKIDSI